MRSLFLAFSVFFSVLFTGPGFVFAEDVSSPVEVIIDGKHFESVLDYKREKIKKILERSLSSINLQEFSEQELNDLISEVRNEQIAEKSSSKALNSDDQALISGDALDLNPTQMQEMLELYNDEHKPENPLAMDPDKVKNVIIESDETVEAGSGE